MSLRLRVVKLRNGNVTEARAAMRAKDGRGGETAPRRQRGRSLLASEADGFVTSSADRSHNTSRRKKITPPPSCGLPEPSSRSPDRTDRQRDNHGNQSRQIIPPETEAVTQS